jgi:hypothetical protein
MFGIDLRCGHRASGGAALRDHSAFWAAGWPQSVKQPLSNPSEHLSQLSRGEPTESARPPPERKRPGLDSASRQPSFVDIKLFDDKPNQRTGLFRSHRGPAIARSLSRLFVSPSDRQT